MDSVWVTIFFFQSILMIIIGFLGFKNHSIKKAKTSSEDSNIKNYFILISKQFSIIFMFMGFFCLIFLILSVYRNL